MVYQLNFPQYQNAVRKILNYNKSVPVDFISDSDDITTLKEVGLLDIWFKIVNLENELIEITKDFISKQSIVDYKFNDEDINKFVKEVINKVNYYNELEIEES